MRFRNKLMAGVAAVALASVGMGSTYALWSKQTGDLAGTSATLRSGSMGLEVVDTKWYKQHIGRNDTYADVIFTRMDSGLVIGNGGVNATPVPDLSTYRPVPGDVLIRVTQLKLKLDGTNLKAHLAISHVDLPQYWQLGTITTKYVGSFAIMGEPDIDVIPDGFTPSAPDAKESFIDVPLKNDEAYVTETFYFDPETAERNGALSQLTFPEGTVTLQQMRR